MTYHHVMNYSHVQEPQSDSDDDSFVDLWAVVEGTANPKPYRKAKQSSSMHTHEQSKHIQIPKSKTSPCKVPSRSPPRPSNFEKRSIKPQMKRNVQQARHQRERKNLRQQETSFDVNKFSQGEPKGSSNRQANRGRRHSLATSPRQEYMQDFKQYWSSSSESLGVRRKSLSPKREIYENGNYHSLSNSEPHQRAFPTMGIEDHRRNGRISNPPNHSSRGVRRQCRRHSLATSPRQEYMQDFKQYWSSSSENLGVRRKSLSPERESYENGNYPSLPNSEPHQRAFPIMGIEDHRRNGRISNPPNHGSRGVRRQSLSTGTENRRNGALLLSSRSDHYRTIQPTRSRTGRRHSLDHRFS